MKIFTIFFILIIFSSCTDSKNPVPLMSQQEERALKEQQQEFLQKKERERLEATSERPNNSNYTSALEKELLGDSLVEEALKNNKNAGELLDQTDVSDEILEINYDVLSDTSTTKFVSNLIAFNNREYTPDDLLPIKAKYIKDTKGNSTLRNEALNALIKLSEDFYTRFKQNIYVISAYRDFAYQEKIKQSGCLDTFCARPGFSEHQSGLAVDLWEASSEEDFLAKSDFKDFFEWLNENAHKYGYINTYQKGVDVDGYEKEPWHWRYVGVQFATFLKQNDFSFAEYYSLKNTMIQ